MDLPILFATSQPVRLLDWEGCILVANVTERKTWLEIAKDVNTHVVITVLHEFNRIKENLLNPSF